MFWSCILIRAASMVLWVICWFLSKVETFNFLFSWSGGCVKTRMRLQNYLTILWVTLSVTEIQLWMMPKPQCDVFTRIFLINFEFEMLCRVLNMQFSLSTSSFLISMSMKMLWLVSNFSWCLKVSILIITWVINFVKSLVKFVDLVWREIQKCCLFFCLCCESLV